MTQFCWRDCVFPLQRYWPLACSIINNEFGSPRRGQQCHKRIKNGLGVSEVGPKFTQHVINFLFAASKIAPINIVGADDSVAVFGVTHYAVTVTPRDVYHTTTRYPAQLSGRVYSLGASVCSPYCCKNLTVSFPLMQTSMLVLCAVESFVAPLHLVHSLVLTFFVSSCTVACSHDYSRYVTVVDR